MTAYLPYRAVYVWLTSGCGYVVEHQSWELFFHLLHYSTNRFRMKKAFCACRLCLINVDFCTSCSIVRTMMPKRFEICILAVVSATAFINSLRICDNNDDVVITNHVCRADSFHNSISRQKGRIEIISLNIGDQPWCRCTDENHRAYAKQHGYLYTRYTKRHPNTTDDVKFSKYNYVMDHMQYSNTSFILLVDCDVIFTNMSVKISDIWSQWARVKTEIILARDPLWYFSFGESIGLKTWRVNTGAILYRSSTWNLQLLCECALKGTVQKCPLRDQTRTELELIRRNQIYAHPSTEFESRDKVSVVSQRVMNSFYYSDHGPFHYYTLLHSAATRWRSGDWMAHVLGASRSSNEFRAQAMKVFGLCSKLNTHSALHSWWYRNLVVCGDRWFHIYASLLNCSRSNFFQ